MATLAVSMVHTYVNVDIICAALIFFNSELHSLAACADKALSPFVLKLLVGEKQKPFIWGPEIH